MTKQLQVSGPFRRVVVVKHGEHIGQEGTPGGGSRPGFIHEPGSLRGGEWWQDNPVVDGVPGAAEWLEGAENIPTAGFHDAKVDPSEIAKLPGARNEQLAIEQDRVDRLAESMRNEGFMPGFKPLVIVEQDGTAQIWEGNHRVRAAIQADIPWIPVEVRYMGGAEELEGVWMPDLVERHGIHVGQEGTPEGGSQPGYTHVPGSVPGSNQGLGTGGPASGANLFAGGRRRDPFPGHGDPNAPSKFPDKETIEEFETGSEPGEADLSLREWVGSGLSRKQMLKMARAGSAGHITLDEARVRFAEFGISFPEPALETAWARALELDREGWEGQAEMIEIVHQLYFMGAEKPDTIDESDFLDFGPDFKDPRLVSALKDYEDRFLDSPVVQLVALNETGQVIYSSSGRVSSITLPGNDEVDLRGSFIMHNHPAGNSLTMEDIASGAELGVNEIYASGGNRRYIVDYRERARELPPLLREMVSDDIWQKTAGISALTRADDRRAIDTGRVDWWQAESDHNHRVIATLVDRYPGYFTYHIEEIEVEE